LSTIRIYKHYFL